MDRRILDDAPDDSELARWEAEGQRHDYSNIVSWVDPDSEFLLEASLDDPVQGLLLRLFRFDGDDVRANDNRLAQTLIPHGDDTGLTTAARLAAAADELDAVDKNPTLGPSYPDLETIEHPDYSPVAPEKFGGTDTEWEQAITDAVDKAERLPGRPSLTIKEIDDREYFYLQWRDKEKVKSQYIAPVDPA